jgi:non-ribosomal peptide synthetase component F
MLEDTGARLILADRRNLALARQLGGEQIEVVDFDEPGPDIPERDLGVYSPTEALALILYTSGSPGRPKGVAHTHQNVLVDVRNITNEWGVSVHDWWLLHTSVSVASSVRTIYGALLNGASLFPYDIPRQGLGGLADWLADREITILRSAPTTFRDFAATLGETRQFPAVRVLSAGGSPLLRGDLESFNRHFLPHCVLVHALGAPECLSVCWACIPHGTRIAGKTLPIGYSLPDKDVLVLDAAGRVLGEGEVGELAVRSRYIATGYWRDPVRTAAAFRPGPSGGGGRVYLTGDVGVRTPGGCLIHIGRADSTVRRWRS